MIFLVGFDFKVMAAHAAQVGGYFELGIYRDRVLGIEAESSDEAIAMFLEKRKNWIRDEEKEYVDIIAICDDETWNDEYYRSEHAWMRKLGI